MPLTREEVVLAYRIVLGREPESEDVVLQHAAANHSLEAFASSLFACDEGARRHSASLHPKIQLRLGLTQADLAELQAASLEYWPPPRPGFVSDFTGTYTRLSTVGLPATWDARHIPLPVPCDYHAEALEWLALIRVISVSPKRFVMAELGAGWGPWTAAGYAWSRRRGVPRSRFHAVEADPTNFALLETHMADNAIPAEYLRLSCEVLAEGAGHVFWRSSAGDQPDFGNRPVEHGGLDYRGLLPSTETKQRQGLPICDFLRREPEWDFVHMDLQGHEEALCRAAMPILLERARFLLVATHSKALDAACWSMLHEGGWQMLASLPPLVTHSTAPPSIEALTVMDGTQFWQNPRLVR